MAALFRRRSQIDIQKLPSSDCSYNIPNTQWVHTTISGLAKLFVVSGFSTLDNAQYYPLVPYTSKNNNFITQAFKYINTISFNPSKGQITSKQIYNSGYLSSKTAYIEQQITCPDFNGTAKYAKYVH